MAKYLLVIAIGYLFGNFQSSYILGKSIKKVDIRTLGFGNAGASNAVTNFGWKMGVVIGILDILKAVISVMVVRQLIGTGYLEDSASYLYVNGFAVMIGHIYPFFMDFKGGKGTASFMGMLFAIDFKAALIGLALITIVTLVTDFIALGTIALTTYGIVLSVYRGYGWIPVVISVVIFLLSTYKHIPNVRRILAGQENGLRHVARKNRKDA
jgi:glycerol-3-phosphate acyltransferase PlsY